MARSSTFSLLKELKLTKKLISLSLEYGLALLQSITSFVCSYKSNALINALR